MYAAGLRLGLGAAALADMSYPTLANLLGSASPEPEGDEGAGTATQQDIDAL